MSGASQPTLLLRPEARGPVLIGHLAGRFGVGSYGDAFRTLRSQIREGTRGVVLDLAELDYLSSAGLAALVRLHADLGARGIALRLAALPSFAARILEVSGMGHLIPVDATVEAAVGALAGAPAPA